MNKDNLKILNGLNKLKYYEFIKYALGIKCFFDEIHYEIRTIEKEDGKDNYKKEKNKDRILAYKYIDGKKTNEYLIRPNDFLNKTFSDKWGEKYSTIDYFDSLGNEIIRIVLYGIDGIDPASLNEQSALLFDGMQLFKRKKSQNLNFIVGAGINHGYGIGEWDPLVDAMRNEIRTLKGIPIPSSPSDILVDFEKKMLNTNYIAPQILKDMDPCIYESAIYQNLYFAFDPTTTEKKHNPTIDDTNLFQIIRIVASRADESKILTFNYDNVLEMVLNNNFSTSYWTSYRYSRSSKIKPKVEIIHSHGFFPYNTSGKPTSHSLILSGYEYMDGYEKSASYARKQLTEQLRKINIIIGNSMTDYEEQKVFFSHHRKYVSDFSFLFTRSSGVGNEWMDYYKLIYYWKMGVIPVFFDTFTNMNNFLKTL